VSQREGGRAAGGVSPEPFFTASLVIGSTIAAIWSGSLCHIPAFVTAVVGTESGSPAPLRGTSCRPMRPERWPRCSCR